MFKVIKELYNIFADTYRKFYAVKLKAKREIENYNTELNKIVNIKNRLLDIQLGIDETYKFLPIEERKDFVQKTYDLLYYGQKTDDGYDGHGVVNRYKYLCELMQMHYKELKWEYSHGRYDAVITLAKGYAIELERFYKNNGIKE